MKVFIILLFIFCRSLAWAQENVVLKLTETRPFEEEVISLERTSDFKFFYKREWIDSLQVSTKKINEQPLSEYLEEALQGTDLFFCIQGNKVFITKGRSLLTVLPDEFPGGQIRKSPTAERSFNYSMYDFPGTEIKEEETRVYTIGINSDEGATTATVSGTVRDAQTGEPVIGATLYIETLAYGTSTDQFGHYSLNVPKGTYKLLVKSIGMKQTVRNIEVLSDGKLNVQLEQAITPLKEVLIESQHDNKVMALSMGVEKLDIQTMKQIPLALGETDIVKVMLTLPGVLSVGEGTSGLNVRGGSANQNLVLLNDATIYNPSHLFGFFSTFNPDVLRNVELYKSGIGAEYGGRLSSVLDVHTRDGNDKKFSGSGGISPVTGRLTLEGPIVKNKTSFIIGGRSTYSNWLLRQLDSEDLRKSKASFYDVTANVTHKANEQNDVYLSAYISKDQFKLNNDTSYSYQDKNAVLKWKHVFNPKLYSVATASASSFNYSVGSDYNPTNAFVLDFNIDQWNVKADVNYFLNSKHTFLTGASMVRYQIQPGLLKPLGNESLLVRDKVENEQAREFALHFSDTYEINRNLTLYLGARYSIYNYLGAKSVFEYSPGTAKSRETLQDTIHFEGAQTIKSYHGIEPRLSIRYALSNSSSVKGSFNRMRQYVQMLTNTTVISPTDIWKLSDPHIRPQVGDQISLGFYKNLKNNTIEASFETYYKKIYTTIDFKDNAELILNKHIETDVIEASGKAYGFEFMVKKLTGKINGWITYTYSRSLLQSKGSIASEMVNKGEYYPSNADKPHAANFIGNYKFSRRFNVSLNLVYSTGRPITLPIAKYTIGNTERLIYSDRNEYRIPNYFRSDISINIEGNHKVKKLAHSSWTIAVYNLTGRDNAYSVFYVTENGKINSYKLSVFARPIPTITYNFKF